MSQQRALRASLIRGGTSKGLYINENQLPSDPEKRARVISRLFGSPDKRQIDGIGGADILTSKVCIMGPPTHPDADVNYTFGQVSIELPAVSFENNCGNLSPGAAVYAIREGFVRATEPVTTVRVFNTNTQRILIAHVPVVDGEPAVDGDFAIDGVPGTGAEVVMDYSLTSGGSTGKLLPFGKPKIRVFFETLGREIDVTVVDIGNLTAIASASDIGVKGTELPDGPFAAYDFYSELQRKIGTMAGLKSTRTLPFTSLVAPPQDYTTYKGAQVKASEIDFVARHVRGPNEVFKTGVIHKAFPGTGSVAISVAALIPGSVVNDLSSGDPASGVVRIGHPSGVMRVAASVDASGETPRVTNVVFSRTVRPIMDGLIYLPESFYASL